MCVCVCGECGDEYNPPLVGQEYEGQWFEKWNCAVSILRSGECNGQLGKGSKREYPLSACSETSSSASLANVLKH